LPVGQQQGTQRITTSSVQNANSPAQGQQAPRTMDQGWGATNLPTVPKSSNSGMVGEGKAAVTFAEKGNKYFAPPEGCLNNEDTRVCKDRLSKNGIQWNDATNSPQMPTMKQAVTKSIQGMKQFMNDCNSERMACLNVFGAVVGGSALLGAERAALVRSAPKIEGDLVVFHFKSSEDQAIVEKIAIFVLKPK